MSKCIEIHIPGLTDGTKGLYFEGVSKSNLFEIINDITNGSSENNGKNLETLNEILNDLEKIKNTSASLTGDALDSGNIGDNVIGNASIMDISRILFRNEIKGSEILLPMFNLLQSAGFNTSSSNIILTTDENVKSGIHLGSKQFKIVLNPTQPDFIAQLYKSLGYAYVEQKIRNKSKISDVIEEYLNGIAEQPTGVVFFDKKISEILKLDAGLKLRAFMAFTADPTNVPEVVKKKIDDLSVLIEADIVKHLQEHIDLTKEWITYGKDLYQKDQALVSAKASELKAQERMFEDQKLAQYYHMEYGKDKDFIIANGGKKKQTKEMKEMLAATRKRVNSIETKLKNPEKVGFVTVPFDLDTDYDKRIEDLRNTIANIKDINVKAQMYESKVKRLSAGWNPYLVDIKTDLLDNVILPDLKFEAVEPRFITIGEENISLKRIKEFVDGFTNANGIVLGAPDPAELEAILAEKNITPLEKSLPYRGAQRKFLKDNVDLFRIFWNPVNHAGVDMDPFDLKAVVNRLTLENTLYLPFEDYKSNLMFDLRGLSLQYGEKSFTNPSPIRRINDFGRDDKYLTVRFTPLKTATLRTKGNELIIPINEELKELPSEVETYLKVNLTGELYLNFGENSNIDADKASGYLKGVISLINNTEDVYRISKVTVKGLNNLQIAVAKAAASMGINVLVLDADELKFQKAFDGYNAKSFPNDIAYKFPDIGDVKLEQMLINNEVTGILYDASLKLQSDIWKLNRILTGNPINLGFTSGNKFRGMVKQKIVFRPSKLAVESTLGEINIGSKVQISEKDKAGRVRILNGNYYVVDVLGPNKTDYLISNGFQTFPANEGQTLTLLKQFPLIVEDDIIMFPMEESNTLLETKTGNVRAMSDKIFLSFYSEELSEVRRITGLNWAYINTHINSKTAYNFGVLEFTPIEKIDVNADGDETISKEDTKSIISLFASKLNSIFGEQFVLIIDSTDTNFVNGETHHPAFIVDGKIYVNIDHPAIHPGSLVHELSHLILGAIKVNSPDEYYKIAESVDVDDKKYDNYKVKYRNRSRSDIQQEILADLFGRYFDKLILDYGSLEEAFNSLSLKDVFKQLFDINGEVPEVLTNSDLMTMTINDAVNKTGSGYQMKTNLFDNEKLYQERKLANFKEELFKNNNLKEECL